MKLYKWLVGLFSAIFFTLIVAWFSSFFFKMDVEWYDSLNKVYFVPTSFVFELCITTSYVLISICLAKLIVSRNFGTPFIFILLNGLFSILFVATFFYHKQIYIATIFVAIIFAFSVTINVKTFLKDKFCALVYFPVTIWNAFMFILSFAIALHN